MGKSQVVSQKHQLLRVNITTDDLPNSPFQVAGASTSVALWEGWKTTSTKGQCCETMQGSKSTPRNAFSSRNHDKSQLSNLCFVLAPHSNETSWNSSHVDGESLSFQVIPQSTPISRLLYGSPAKDMEAREKGHGPPGLLFCRSVSTWTCVQPLGVSFQICANIWILALPWWSSRNSSQEILIGGSKLLFQGEVGPVLVRQ